MQKLLQKRNVLQAMLKKTAAQAQLGDGETGQLEGADAASFPQEVKSL